MIKFNKIVAIGLSSLLSFSLIGCVDQTQETLQTSVVTEDLSIAASSTAIMTICERMGIPLTGVPQSSLVEIPEIYADATVIGSPMAPDLELLKDLNPNWVLSPVTLISDLQPKYEAAGLNYAFMNLKSVEGMYDSIQGIGELFGYQESALELVQEYEEFLKDYNSDIEGIEPPTVLMLMGLPGSYVVATENSYVGNLLELAGGINVYAGTNDEFLNVNPEDMLLKNPDIIIRTAHAMPDDVTQMFIDEFEENDIWKHFDAVKNKQVYDTPYECFGMSATFNYQDGLEYLKEILYQEER